MAPLSGMQSALQPAGSEAAAIAGLSWVLFAGGAVIFVAVVSLAAWAVFRPSRWLSSSRVVVWGGVVFPVVTLTALLVHTWLVAPRMHGSTPADIVIEVIGEQWWWRLHYLDAGGGLDFATANEIRIPVGRTVEVRLKSADVLHSFWVPALAGKLDLIPGRTNRLQFSADRPGRFRGQCAEYCGGPHALMAMFVLVEGPVQFEAWRAGQRKAHASGARAIEGRRLFEAHCATCHAVRGTKANGTLGPDLTHLASRSSLGAGLVANSEQAVATWITSSQHLKPGNLMPEFRSFTGPELQALAVFLSAPE